MPRTRHCYDYARPMMTVDAVVLRVRGGQLELLLIRRKSLPFKGDWALPGGFIRMKETLPQSLMRELREETGLKELSFLGQLGAYGDPGRDPRGRTISVAYLGIVAAGNKALRAGTDAAQAVWHRAESLPEPLAFDHTTIVMDALLKVCAGGRGSTVLLAFVPRQFTKADFEAVLRAVYGVELPAAEYLKPLIEVGFVRRVKRGKAYRWGD